MCTCVRRARGGTSIAYVLSATWEVKSCILMCLTLTERRTCAEETCLGSELGVGTALGAGSTHDLTVREAVSSLVRVRVTVRVVGFGLIQVRV